MAIRFPLTFPTFPTTDSLRRFRYHVHEKLPTRLGLRLERWETDRFYYGLQRAEGDCAKRLSLQDEHMWQVQEIEERRALYFSDATYAKAKHLYIDVPPLTGRDDDPNWERCSRIAYGRHYLKPAAVEVLRVKIREEAKAFWEPAVRWSGWIAAIGTWAASLL